MNKITQARLSDAHYIYSLTCNEKRNAPLSQPKPEWSIPVYYVWRMLRFDLGYDTTLPVVAESHIYGHPQEKQAKETLEAIEDTYFAKEKNTGALRWKGLI